MALESVLRLLLAPLAGMRALQTALPLAVAVRRDAGDGPGAEIVEEASGCYC